jgi:hypothetical protein
MNSVENPYNYVKNIDEKVLNAESIKQYKALCISLKRVVTQVEFKKYLVRKGYQSVAEFIKHIKTVERHKYSNPSSIDRDIIDREYRSGYWYKLFNGQSISTQTKTFQINDALGFYEAFGFVHPFWNLLNRQARVPNCAYQLPTNIRKRIFKTHHFSNGLSTKKFIDNCKQINPVQLEYLYEIKSIDSLLALTIMCVSHHYRGGKKVSRKIERHLYAQFLFLMIYKYGIKVVGELYVFIFYLLESNSLYQNDKINESLNISQLVKDKAFVNSLPKSRNLLPNPTQDTLVSLNIITYLKEQKAHPFFHSYDK